MLVRRLAKHAAPRRLLPALRRNFGAAASAGRLQNVYHASNPMARHWRKRDLLACLRETFGAEDIESLGDQVLSLNETNALHPQEATLLISKFGKAGNANKAQMVYSLGVRDNSSRRDILRVKSAFIHALMRNGQLEQARDVFLELDRDISFSLDAVVVGAGAQLAQKLNDPELLQKATDALEAGNLEPPLEYHVAKVAVEAANSAPLAAEAIVESIIEEKKSVGHVLTPKEASPLYEALVEGFANANEHADVVRVASKMLDTCQRPTEQVVLRTIEAVDQLEDPDAEMQLLYHVFSRFRAGPRIRREVYEKLIAVLLKHGKSAGAITMYDEASAKQRPSKAMDDLIQGALRKLPRALAMERAQKFGITIPEDE